uniref:CD99 antigen-like protein 2 n=1 Tax=Dromaius novaehollandiae TaxID=8790 RepID=A0A8C4JG91_DRONO
FSSPPASDNSLWDVVRTTTTKQPKTTRAPPRHKPGERPGPRSCCTPDRAAARLGRAWGRGTAPPPLSRLEISLVGGAAAPRGRRGSGAAPLPCASLRSASPAGSVAETGTIAGIASALAMALIGAVSSYISYQQKKFCFSIQQGLNAEYVKGENMEAVVSEEPQVKYSVLETQSAEPPKQDSAKL